MVTVATWNLENLFGPGGESGPRTPEAYDAKLAALAATIGRSGADVLALQEVGEEAALADLVERLEGDWHTGLSRQPDGRGIRVGFLSRLPLRDVGDHGAFPEPLAPVQAADDASTTRTGRGALLARVDAGGEPLHLLTCHLKSKLLSYPGGRFAPRDEGERARYAAFAVFRRAAEAVVVRGVADDVLDGRGRERRLVVLGDLNDEAQAATTQLLLGPPGSQLGTGGFDQPDRGDGMRLWNLAPRIPAERRYSRVFAGRPELIDHVLVSHALLGDVRRVDTSARDLPSVGTDPTARRDAPGSDHAMVLVELDL